jgi:hypothetical protein
MESFITNYLRAKRFEEEAKQVRLAAEARLIAAVNNDKLEGSMTVDTPHFKVSVANKLTRTLDYEAYQSLAASLPETLQFVDMDPKINLTKLRHLEAVDPTIVARCVTVKPAKPSITIKEV